MAGHSKWANIRFRKAAQDAKRGKIFTKLIREITIAARMGGPDIESNSRLRLAIDKALGANMKRDTINNAVKRGAGDAEGDNLEELRYEGYGPGGVAVLVDCLTDNRNRTVAEVRHAFSKCGGNLGTDGSVAYLFAKCGQFNFTEGNEDKIMEVAIEAGADDVITHDDGNIEVVTTPEAYEEVRDAFNANELNPEIAELTFSASTEIELDEETAEKLLKLLDMLEDLDDVQEVYSNAAFPENMGA